jgi:hypothetical protein
MQVQIYKQLSISKLIIKNILWKQVKKGQTAP